MATTVIPAPARLARHFEIENSANGCWLWTGCLSSQGEYPGFTDDEGNFIYAHRAMYIWTYGEIPADHHVHHTCENRLCINPDHLIALTPEEHRARHAAECARRRVAKGTLWMHFRYDLSMTAVEIGKAVGLSAKTVRSYIHEARAAQTLQVAA
jgi:hypothetical protein